MNVSNSTKKLLLFLLILTSAKIHTQAETITIPQNENCPVIQDNQQSIDLNDIPKEELNEIMSNLSQMMDNMITRIISQTVLIEGLLEELSHATNNEAFGKKNKPKLLKQIKNIRLTINDIKSKSFVDVDLVTLYLLTNFNSILVEHISESVKKGFKNLPSFEDKIALLFNRNATNININIIEEQLEKNYKSLEKLSIESNQIGLTWYNKLTRKLSAILFIANKKKWTNKLKHALVFGGIGTHLLMKYTPLFYTPEQLTLIRAAKHADRSKVPYDYMPQNIPESPEERRLILLGKKTEHPGNLFTETGRFLRNNFFGAPIIYNHKGKPISGILADEYNENLVGTMGKIDATISSIFPVMFAAYVPALQFAYGPTCGMDFINWTKQNLTKLYGKLTGGVTGKQIIQSQKNKMSSEKTKYNFDDVVGLDHIKNTLKNILEYMKDPERFERAGIVPEQGYLFTGAPGTGKSFVAEALGGEIRKLFVELGKSKEDFGFYNFDSKEIKDYGIKWLLDILKQKAPCIIFIDEIDLLCLQRGSNNSDLLGEFLAAMSGVLSKDSGKQVILIAATNKPEHLDEALRRRGRFGKIIHFELPTLIERKTFLIKKLFNLIPDLSLLDLDKLAEETEGRTYEELSAVTNNAFQKAKQTAQPITQKFLENALDEELRNIMIKTEINISKEEQKLIASHQAGHALAIELLQSRRKLSCATIRPITTKLQDESIWAQYYGKREQKDVIYGKVFTKCSFDHIEIYTKEEKIKECKILLAGMIAERILLGSCGHSYHANYKQKALDIVKSLVFEGLHVKTMPKKIQLKYFETALETLKQYEVETEKLLKDNKSILKNIAKELQTYKTLSAKRIKKIIAS